MQTKTFAVTGMMLVIVGCGGGAQLITDPDLLTYTATSQVTSNKPMTFSTTVTISNGTSQSLSFRPSGCAIPRTLIYTNASRTGTPIWDSSTRPPPPCALAVSVTLAPGKSVSYTLTATGAEALGASGAAGTYYLTDEVTLDGVPYAASAGQLSLAR
ncbi:MAG: hypothetical protein ABR582_00045 [Gemmatimonadaceae bacterium]